MGDGDAFDLSAILDPSSPPSVPPPPAPAPAARPGFAPGFTFPGTTTTEEELAALEAAAPVAPPPLAREEPERAALASGDRARTAAATVPAGDADVWRVRNANQTTYDMVSIDSVVQWLANKDSFDGIRIARGNGSFRTVEDHPELVARLGLRSGAQTGFSGSESAPKLDMEAAPRRPPGTRVSQPARPEGKSPRAAGPTAAKAREPARHPERTYGTGLILVVTAGCLLASVLLVLIAQGAGIAPPATESVPPAPAEAPGPPGPGLAAALQAFDATRYTAAEQLLQQAARTEKEDPRVFRYLAVTLSKLGGRDREARAALAEYRRLRARAGRD